MTTSRSEYAFYRDDGRAVYHEIDRAAGTSIMRVAPTMDEARRLVGILKWRVIESRRDLLAQMVKLGQAVDDLAVAIAGPEKLERELGLLCDALKSRSRGSMSI